MYHKSQNDLKNCLSPKTEYSNNRRINKFEEVCDTDSIGKLGFQLFIRPTEFCNFSCRYCFNYTKDTNPELQWSLNDILNLENYLKEIKKDIHNIRIYIHGGEPLSFKYLKELIETLVKYATTIDIQTNLTLFKMEDYEQFNYDQIKFSISIHEDTKYKKLLPIIEFLFSKDKISRLDTIVSKDNKKQFIVYEALKMKYPIVQTIGLFQDSQDIYPKVDIDSYYDRKFRVEYIPHSDHPKDTPLREELSFYAMYKKSLIYNMKGLWCESGYSGFLINNDGKIYRCQADMNFRTNEIGNIKLNKFPKRKVTKCTNEYCVADFEYRRFNDLKDWTKEINCTIPICGKYDGD